jgi:hypothetical protein
MSTIYSWISSRSDIDNCLHESLPMILKRLQHLGRSLTGAISMCSIFGVARKRLIIRNLTLPPDCGGSELCLQPTRYDVRKAGSLLRNTALLLTRGKLPDPVDRLASTVRLTRLSRYLRRAVF